MQTSSAPLRIAIVGAGVAGLATAARLVELAPGRVQIDILDAEPVPFGLLRTGVAPDHDATARLVGTFAPLFDAPEVTFYGGVAFGRDIVRADLTGMYDAVVYATGAPEDRLLGVPGEDLAGVRSGREFAQWYTGAAPLAAFDLAGVVNAVVVGLGDVAVDLARMLLKSPADLHQTDMPAPVLAHLSEHRVKNVTILVRRGPEDCRLKARDLEELLNLDKVAVRFDPRALDVDVSEASEKVQAAMPLWRAALDREVEHPHGRLKIRFWTRPVEFRGEGRVDGVKIQRTAVDTMGRLLPCGEPDMIPAQLVLRATGARGRALDDVPFDAVTGRIPTARHRVVDADGVVQPGEYAAGWIANGWVGGFGSQRRDGAAVAEQLLADRARPAVSLGEVLAQRGVTPVPIDGWRRVVAEEARQGAEHGRASVRLADPVTLQSVARG